MNESKTKPKPKRSRRKNRPNQRPATAFAGQTSHSDLRFRTPLFPPRFKKKLFYYEDSLNVTSTSGVTTSYFFSANGLYDVNVTGTGHQPMGFDQMMAMYEQYTVVSSKMTLHVQNWSAANVYTGAGLYLSPDVTQVDHNVLIENGFVTWKTLHPIEVSGSLAMMNLNCDVSTYFGRNADKRGLTTDSTLAGAAASNPSEQVYYGIFPFDFGGNSTVKLIFAVEIEYEVIFWEPRKLSQS